MKVYISGGITKDFNYMEKFKNAEEKLAKMGHIVLNPTWIKAGLSYEEHMHIDLAMIDVCDALYMLPDWKDSKGANVEINYANTKHKLIIYEGA